VWWNGQLLTSLFNGPTQLTASVPANLLTAPGVYAVQVINPAPGGGASFTQPLTLTYPTLTLTPDPLFIKRRGSGTMTLTLSAPMSQSIAVNLASSNDAVATTTTPLNLPAGTVVMPLTVNNPNSGGQAGTATLTATLPSSLGGGQALANAQTNQVILGPTGLTLTLNAATNSITSSITVTRLPNANVNVALASSNNSIGQIQSVVDMNNQAAQMAPVTSTLGGSVWITGTDSTAGGPYTDAITITVYYPVPAITSLVPLTLTQNSPTQTLAINGQNFMTGAVAYANGVPLPNPTVINATQMTATLPASLTAATGSLTITVTNLSPTLGPSNSAVMTVAVPAPNLTLVTPLTASVGGPTLTLTLTGSNFIAASQVSWNAQPLVTTFVSATRLTANVSATLLTAPGVYAVQVTNPPPAGGASVTQPLTLTYPTLTLTPDPLSLKLKGNGTMTLTLSAPMSQSIAVALTSSVMGVASVPVSVNLAAGTTITTFTVSNPNPPLGQAGSATLTATLPSGLGGGTAVAQAQTTQVLLGPQGLTLTLNAATSSITATLTLTRRPSANVTVGITTSNLALGQTPTSVNMSNQVTQPVPFTSTLGGVVWITATDNSAGGPYTDSISITVYHPAPTITAVTPPTVSAGSPTQTLLITGTNFFPGAVAYWSGTPLLNLTVISSTRMTATLPASLITVSGTFSLSVNNPAPAVAGSNVWSYNVNFTDLNEPPKQMLEWDENRRGYARLDVWP
jgi:hypothetical protein